MTDLTNAPPDEPLAVTAIREASKKFPLSERHNSIVSYIDTLRAQLSAETARADACERDAKRIWHYRTDPPANGDARKLVTLHEGGMRWIGLRAWNFQNRHWMNGGEPERAKVHAWAHLPEIAEGDWQSGNFADIGKDAADLWKPEDNPPTRCQHDRLKDFCSVCNPIDMSKEYRAAGAPT